LFNKKSFKDYPESSVKQKKSKKQKRYLGNKIEEKYLLRKNWMIYEQMKKKTEDFSNLSPETKLFAEELSKGLYEIIFLDLCSPHEVDDFKKELNLEEVENVEEGYFCLIMFLITYSCQITFTNRDLLRVILDNFHK
jgi:hypothetical protein